MKENRRSFFAKLTGGMLVGGLFTIKPLSALSKQFSKVEENNEFQVKIHPAAIKRNERKGK